jgi:hypothetical protein
MSGINHWKGKVPFEDFVTERLYEIDNKLTETNRLLSVIAGESTQSEDTKKLKSKLEKVADILDNGELDGSIKETTNKLFKKRK